MQISTNGSFTNWRNRLQAENDAIGQELQKQLEAAGKIYIFSMKTTAMFEF